MPAARRTRSFALRRSLSSPREVGKEEEALTISCYTGAALVGREASGSRHLRAGTPRRLSRAMQVSSLYTSTWPKHVPPWDPMENPLNLVFTLQAGEHGRRSLNPPLPQRALRSACCCYSCPSKVPSREYSSPGLRLQIYLTGKCVFVLD